MKKQYTDPELEIVEFTIEQLMTNVSNTGDIPDTGIDSDSQTNSANLEF